MLKLKWLKLSHKILSSLRNGDNAEYLSIREDIHYILLKEQS